MIEIIVRIMRAIACRRRLAIIAYLIRSGESAPVEVASALEMARNVLSTHLRSLTGAGLLARRRSGVWLYCTVESPYGEQALSGRIAAWLWRALCELSAKGDDSGVRELRNHRQAERDVDVHELVFDAATAFTNVRRLQILRRIVETGAASPQTLSAELEMSLQAVGRHTDKLVRRGYLARARGTRGAHFDLPAGFKSLVHKALFEIVREHWHAT